MSRMICRAGLLSLVLAIPLSASMLAEREFPKDWYWDDEKTEAGHVALEGKPMPEWSVADWINGEVKPEDLKGKVVVVDLYATWCGPCMKAVPHNNEMLEKYKDQGFALIGICTSGNGQEKFAENAKQFEMKYPVARDPDLKTEKAFGVFYYPTYMIIDRNGTVRAVGIASNRVEDVVKKLLAEKQST